MVSLLTSSGVALYFPLQYAGSTLAELVPRNVGPASTYANRPWPVQTAFCVHIVFVGVAMPLGPIQFFQTLRRRHVRVRRGIGRAYVVSMLVRVRLVASSARSADPRRGSKSPTSRAVGATLRDLTPVLVEVMARTAQFRLSPR